jgi:hypothetical protein
MLLEESRDRAQQLCDQGACLRAETRERRLRNQELLECCRQAQVANRMLLLVVLSGLGRVQWPKRSESADLDDPQPAGGGGGEEAFSPQSGGRARSRPEPTA